MGGQSSVTDQPPEQPNHQSKTEPKLKTDKTSRRKKSEDGQQGSAELPQTKPISALGACIHHRRHEQGDQDEESDLEQRPAASEEYQSKAEVAQNAKAGGYAEDFENVRCCEHTAGGTICGPGRCRLRTLPVPKSWRGLFARGRRTAGRRWELEARLPEPALLTTDADCGLEKHSNQPNEQQQ